MGWVHLPRGIEIEWVKQLVAEQLRTAKDKRGFTRQEWAKLRERNEALDCAVLARAALWLLGADRYGDRYWQRLQTEIADAPVLAPVATETATAEEPEPSSAPTASRLNDQSMRPRSWLGQRSGWLR